MKVLIVNVVEWGEEHLQQNFPCDCGVWFVDAFAGDSNRFFNWHLRRNQPIPSEKFDGIVISGSGSSTYDGDTWIDELTSHIRNWVDQNIPILGVCFGHQLICEALGGKVEKNEQGWEVGTCQVELNEAGLRDPIFKNIPQTLSVMQSHQDIVTEMPSGAECLVSSPKCEFQSMRIGDYIRTIQFHPEYTPDQMRFMIKPRRQRLESAGTNVDQTLADLATTPESRIILSNFEQYFVLNFSSTTKAKEKQS